MAKKNTNQKCWLPDLESYHTVEDYLYEKEPAPGIPFFGLSITMDCCEGILLNLSMCMEDDAPLKADHSVTMNCLDVLQQQLKNSKLAIQTGFQTFLSGTKGEWIEQHKPRFNALILPQYKSLDEFFFDKNGDPGFPIHGFVHSLDQGIGVLNSIFLCGFGQEYFVGNNKAIDDALHFVSKLLERMKRTINIALDSTVLLEWRPNE